MPRLSHRHALLAVCLGFALLALAYAAATPPFEAPDEGAHFLYAHNLLETGALPLLESREAVFRSRAVQRHHPPLYYAVGALLIAPFERDAVQQYLTRSPFAAVGMVSANNQNVYLHPTTPYDETVSALFVWRLFSIALGTATVWLVGRAGELAFPGVRVGLLAALFTAALPGFAFSAASVNNDNLVTLLYAAAVVVLLAMWRRGGVARADVVALAVIAPAAALTKLTGLALVPVVGAWLAFGAWRGVWRWRAAVAAALVVGASAFVGAFWWYARNWALYGDPFALAATRRIWGRGAAVSEGLNEVLFEAKGVWDSFWMTLGHFNIRAPEWFYVYAAVVVVGGAVGAVAYLMQQRQRRRHRTIHDPWAGLLLLLGVVALVVAALALATRQINISQGRILYPALVGFMPLLALGWRTLLRRWAGAAAAPLALVALAAPLLALGTAYRGLDALSADAPLPTGAHILNAAAETMTLHAYAVREASVTPGGLVTVDLWFSGRDADNPAFFIKALDPVTGETLGGVDTYPGMVPTAQLAPDVRYHAVEQFRLDPAATRGRDPLRLRLVFGWREPESGRYHAWTDADGGPLAVLSVDGVTLVDAEHQPPAPAQRAEVVFGGAIRLVGYTLTPAENGALAVTTVWERAAPMTTDYTLTLGLLDAQGRLLAQADAPPAGYPTSTWAAGERFAETRLLASPRGFPVGSVRLYAAWYTAPDFARLAASGAGVGADGTTWEIAYAVDD